jgi:hypothetical protein
MTKPVASDETALAHHLPYWWIADHAFVNVDGAMAIGWAIYGVDIACELGSNVNEMTRVLRATLNALPAGYHLQWLRRAQPIEDAYFGSYLSAFRCNEPIFREQRERSVETLRARGLRRFETYCLLCKPRALGRFGSAGRDPLSRLFNRVFARQDPLAIALHQHEEAIHDLEEAGHTLVNGLTMLGVMPHRLDDEDLLRLAFLFINPSEPESAVPRLEGALPRELPLDGRPIFRDLSLREQLLRTSLAWDLDLLHLDDPLRPHRVLAMKELPRQTRAALIRGAQGIPFEHWLSIGISALDTREKEGKIERRRNVALVTARGSRVPNVKAEVEFQELQESLGALAGDERLFHLSLHLLVSGADLVELDDRTRLAVDVFRREMNVSLQTATYAQLQGWLGMLPGNGHAAPHKRCVLTSNAADFIPIYASSAGARRPLLLLSHRSGEPFALDIANPGKGNWNANIFGGSGSGKSFYTCATIASSIIGQASPLIVIDVGGRDDRGRPVGSYHRLCELAGGEYYEVALDGSNAVSPFYSRTELYTSTEGQPVTTPDPVKLLFLTGIVEMLVRDAGQDPLTTVQSRILQRAILAAYDRWAAERAPVLGDLVPELRALEGDRDDRDDARAFAKTLEAWIGGPYGALLDTPSKVRPRSDFVVFDMKGLESLHRLAPVVMMIVSAYVWSMISRPRQGLAWVIYDECWKLLCDPTAAKLQEELYRTARKLKAGVVSITQRIHDFLAAPGAGAILANAESTFLLAHNENRETVAEHVHLNARERELFATLQTRKGHFSEILFKPADGFVDRPALLRYYPGPLDYWINTTDPTDRALEYEVLHACGGDRLGALRRLAADYPHGAVAGGYVAQEARA